ADAQYRAEQHFGNAVGLHDDSGNADADDEHRARDKDKPSPPIFDTCSDGQGQRAVNQRTEAGMATGTVQVGEERAGEEIDLQDRRATDADGKGSEPGFEDARSADKN